MKKDWASRGDRLATVGAVLIIISIFEPWYQWRTLIETAQASLWQADARAAAALLGAAFLVIAFEVWRYLVKVGELRQNLAESAVVLLAALVAAALIVWRVIVFPAGLGVTTALVPGDEALPQKVETVSKTVPVAAGWGQWLGLAATAVLCLGALIKLAASGQSARR